MRECKEAHQLFMDGLYNRLNAEQNMALANHLKSCEKCASEYSEMTETLLAMRQRRRPEPEPSFWEEYWDKMSVKLYKENAPPSLDRARKKKLYRFFTISPRWVLQAAAALLILLIGIYAGKTIFTSKVNLDRRSQVQQTLADQAVAQTDLKIRTSNYVERSKRILLAIMNFDTEREDSYVLDLPYKKQISRDLVQEASYLKSELSVAHQNRLKNLVGELERILLQIANLESEHNLDSIELIQGGVDWQGILLKIHLSDMREAKRRSQASAFPDEKRNFGYF